ncbi:MAG: CHAT domain-containing protein [Elainellaceae cyanobacterium]
MLPSSEADIPCLSLAIGRLGEAEARQYVVWVLEAPYPGGYALHDRPWQPYLSRAWSAWQMMFSQAPAPFSGESSELELEPSPGPPMNYTSRLMQHLGIRLWRWLFDSAIGRSLDKSQGVALGQRNSLRLRLAVRDANLIQMPWEIMQASAGQRPISLGSPILFSRTISEVEPLPPLQEDANLRILLVVGQPSLDAAAGSAPPAGSLNLDRDFEALAQAMEDAGGPRTVPRRSPSSSQVTRLIQPSPAELISHLSSSSYNMFVYAGHGAPGPDGGRLFLSPGREINGMELAQVLAGSPVKLAVFNACWGAQADRDSEGLVPRSSLAEVLVCQGVPAVLGMRDTIADSEALSFIQAFTAALSRHGSIDLAVAEARQQLLTLYKFNCPAWTLPVLYMHPEFNGQLLSMQEEGTEIPEISPQWVSQITPAAALRTVDALPRECWPVEGGLMRVGKEQDNDLVLRGPGVSRRHAEIVYRDALMSPVQTSAYYLRDFSRFGTFIRQPKGWRRVHNQEVPLTPYTQVKFGSQENPSLEFVTGGDGSSSVGNGSDNPFGQPSR